MLSHIVRKVRESDSIRAAVESVRGAREPLRIGGLAGSSTSIFAGILHEDLGVTTAIVCPDESEGIREDLESLLGEDRVFYFPDWEVLPYDEFSPHDAIVGTRLETLAALLDGRTGVVVIPLRAFLRQIMPPEDLAESIVRVSLKDRLEPRDLIAKLVEMGYARHSVVEDVGAFAMRGGIVDVFVQGRESPVRIELFGDEVESIREFDPVTQRSTGKIGSVRILPAREVLMTEASAGRFMGALKGRRLKGKHVEEVALHVKDRFFFDGIEAYARHFYSRPATITSYLPDDAAYIFLDPVSLEARAESVAAETEARFKDGKGRAGGLPLPGAVFLGFNEARSRLTAGAGGGGAGGGRTGESGPGGSSPRENSTGGGRVVDVPVLRTSPDTPWLDFRSPESFGGSLKVLNSVIEEAIEEGYEVHILCDNIGQAERLEEVVSAADEVPGGAVPGEAAGRGTVNIAVGGLRKGFIFPEARLKVLTDHEIFGRYRRKPRYPRFRGEGPLESYRALSAGDFVVHVNHGIGRYGGTQRLTVEGRETECLLVNYQAGDKLYVPIDQLDLLQKYIGKDGEPPSLSKLGGAAWEKIKARTRKAIREMAEELIKIYAMRKARPGHAFPPDTRWQKELEASFIYDDTPDQSRATSEIKEDMESARPMDRLICGDVGYGKTEVAIRAAFKAVMDGKQVAILVPTTVLAQQHFYTFTERLAEYPLKVEMLSRFRSRAEQKKIVADLKEGKVDIVIGTHRLIQKDVEFKDLGLIIIDEEQRFGVAHKETFKKMRATLDVLTLTATPIPRTLHMALLGVRDMSIIDTPPKHRLPVDTEVVQFDEDVIVSAVLRELDRGGQVFFVHNRVETIATVAAHVSQLLPEARIAIAHGQMKERELERVMLDFVNRESDILVSTMIVESGLDIPNVNTIIVNRADTLGLAQLYQLRGRVGRSRHRAYAYLLVPRRMRLTDDQRKRLKTLTEFTDLGSGFKIAMRDLEIRGAGNILGPQQSGFIAEVGFDLYCRLLEEAAREIKGEPVVPRLKAKVETDLAAYIPETYVSDEKQRVLFYKRLVELQALEAVDALKAELEDRYGRYPREVSNLLEFQKIRILAARTGIERIVVKRSTILLETGKDRKLPMKLMEAIVRTGVGIELKALERPCIKVTSVPDGERERLETVRKVLLALAAV